jgi:hypothetical protein
MQGKKRTVFVVTAVGGAILEDKDGNSFEFPTEQDAIEWLHDSGRGGDYHIDMLVIHQVPQKEADVAHEVKLSSALKAIDELQKMVQQLTAGQEQRKELVTKKAKSDEK